MADLNNVTPAQRELGLVLNKILSKLSVLENSQKLQQQQIEMLVDHQQKEERQLTEQMQQLHVDEIEELNTQLQKAQLDLIQIRQQQKIESCQSEHRTQQQEYSTQHTSNELQDLKLQLHKLNGVLLQQQIQIDKLRQQQEHKTENVYRLVAHLQKQHQNMFDKIQKEQKNILDSVQQNSNLENLMLPSFPDIIKKSVEKNIDENEENNDVSKDNEYEINETAKNLHFEEEKSQDCLTNESGIVDINPYKYLNTGFSSLESVEKLKELFENSLKSLNSEHIESHKWLVVKEPELLQPGREKFIGDFTGQMVESLTEEFQWRIGKLENSTSLESRLFTVGGYQLQGQVMLEDGDDARFSLFVLPTSSEHVTFPVDFGWSVSMNTSKGKEWIAHVKRPIFKKEVACLWLNLKKNRKEIKIVYKIRILP